MRSVSQNKKSIHCASDNFHQIIYAQVTVHARVPFVPLIKHTDHSWNDVVHSNIMKSGDRQNSQSDDN